MTGSRRWRWHWGTGIAAVYATFATGTIAFVTFAMQQRVDLVTPDYYAQALAHDARTAAMANARALGPAFAAATTEDTRTLRVVWPPAAIAAPVRGTITLYRPSDATADRVIDLAPDGDCTQRVPLGGLAAGWWRAKIAWTAAGQAYYAEHDFRVGP